MGLPAAKYYDLALRWLSLKTDTLATLILLLFVMAEEGNEDR